MSVRVKIHKSSIMRIPIKVGVRTCVTYANCRTLLSGICKKQVDRTLNFLFSRSMLGVRPNLLCAKKILKLSDRSFETNVLVTELFANK